MNTVEKILADPIYSKLYKEFGFDYVLEAGYFDDSMNEHSSIDYMLNYPTTPILKWIKNVDRNKKQCILLNSGSFCPVHKGHFDTMVESKKMLAEMGIEVLHGYISPSHDEYITYKNRDKAINIHKRLAIIQNEINLNYDWLSIEPWEGIFNSRAINFTEVQYRLTQYIKHHIGFEIPVYFICGGDNANFSKSFTLDGYCIVVGRPNYEQKFNKYKNELQDNSRILFVDGYNDMSSTKVRKTFDYGKQNEKQLNIRLTSNNGVDYFDVALYSLFKNHFTHINLHLLSEQKKEFNTYKNSGNIMSLDPFMAVDYNLQISRNYDYFGVDKLNFINRPDSEPLDEQITKLNPELNYILFDDDICSGNTMKYVRNLLSEHNINVSEVKSFVKNDAHGEVIDSRGFLLGAEEGGLVVDSKFRFPYIYPYVCPCQRCSIENDGLQFSINVWYANKEHYGHTDVKIRDKRNLIWLHELVGLDLDMKLSDVCDLHIKLLSNFL